MPEAPRSAILSDGGLAALIACAADAERSHGAQPGLVVFVPSGKNRDDDRRTAAGNHARTFGQAFLALDPVANGQWSRAESVSARLLHAAHAAARADATELIWPVQPGGRNGSNLPDIDAMAADVDRALLVERLVSLDSANHAADFRISTPYIDLSDRQIADLATDMGVDVTTCWWWKAEGESASVERLRWCEALREFGWAEAAG